MDAHQAQERGNGEIGKARQTAQQKSKELGEVKSNNATAPTTTKNYDDWPIMDYDGIYPVGMDENGNITWSDGRIQKNQSEGNRPNGTLTLDEVLGPELRKKLFEAAGIAQPVDTAELAEKHNLEDSAKTFFTNTNLIASVGKGCKEKMNADDFGKIQHELRRIGDLASGKGGAKESAGQTFDGRALTEFIGWAEKTLKPESFGLFLKTIAEQSGGRNEILRIADYALARYLDAPWRGEVKATLDGARSEGATVRNAKVSGGQNASSVSEGGAASVPGAGNVEGGKAGSSDGEFEVLKECVALDLGRVVEELIAPGDGQLMALLRAFARENAEQAVGACFALRKLGSSASVVAYALAKELFGAAPGRRMNVFAWSALSTAKVLRGELGKGTNGAYESCLKRIVEELSRLAIPGSDEFAERLRAQVAHYRAVVLGDAGPVDALLEAARAAYAAEPENVGLVERLGWCLHDCLGVALRVSKDRSRVEALAGEIRALPRPDGLSRGLADCLDGDVARADDFLNGTGKVRDLVAANDLEGALAAARALVEATPKNAGAHLALAQVFDRMERPREALKAYAAAVKLDVANARAQTGLAWAFCHLAQAQLKAKWSLASDRPPFAALAANVLDRGIKLDLLPRPSVVYSRLLESVTRLVKSAGKEVSLEWAERYLSYLQRWDLATFRPEDWQSPKPKDTNLKPFPSLVSQVATAAYHCAMVSDGRAPLLQKHPWVCDFLAQAVERNPSEQWLPYFYAKLLVALGRQDEAASYALKVARRRPRDPWGWQLLAETCPGDLERQVICFCRALSEKVQDETFLVGVHERLAEILRQQGRDDEALREYHLVDTLRASKGWRPKRRDAAFESWRAGRLAKGSNATLYAQAAAHADAFLLDGIQRLEALLLARYRDQIQNEEAAKLWLRTDPPQTIRTTPKRWAILRNLTPGAPLWVWPGETPSRPIKMELRDAKPWSGYPQKTGIVTYQDTRRGTTTLTIGDDGTECWGDWKKFPVLKPLAPGTLCTLATERRKDGREGLLYAVPLDTNQPSLPSFAKRFEAELKILPGKRFAFAGDAFVPEWLVAGIPAGSKVQVLAVRSFNKSKNYLGWQAVSIQIST
ncbi:MAG: DUF7017 domain-containing protein [Kiritimatiellia bacterium]